MICVAQTQCSADRLSRLRPQLFKFNRLPPLHTPATCTVRVFRSCIVSCISLAALLSLQVVSIEVPKLPLGILWFFRRTSTVEDSEAIVLLVLLVRLGWDKRSLFRRDVRDFTQPKDSNNKRSKGSETTRELRVLRADCYAYV